MRRLGLRFVRTKRDAPGDVRVARPVRHPVVGHLGHAVKVQVLELRPVLEDETAEQVFDHAGVGEQGYVGV